MRHMMNRPLSPSAIEWYSLPNGFGLWGRDMKPGQNLFSQMFINSSMQLSHDGEYSVA
jgi:hypothetical protein